MIDGFEDITLKLSPYETETVLPILFKGLCKKVGKEKAVTNKEICEGLAKKGIKTSGPRVRKLINFLRHNHIPNLMATSKGYYIANDKEEMLRWVNSLKQREEQIGAIRKKAELFLAQH